jgi:hypothetical protein
MLITPREHGYFQIFFILKIMAKIHRHINMQSKKNPQKKGREAQGYQR